MINFLNLNLQTFRAQSFSSTYFCRKLKFYVDSDISF